MTQESPAEKLLRMGGIGSQAQPRSGNGGGSRSNPGRQRDDRGGSPQRRGLPDGYLSDGYFDEEGNVLERLIVSDAQTIARELERGGMTRNQLRNFYNEVATIRRLLGAAIEDTSVEAKEKKFAELRPRILKLIAFASNATSQRANKAPPLFYDFISKNVTFASAKRESFLEGFYEHFECVVLYFNGR